jgi:hypothetical protein
MAIFLRALVEIPFQRRNDCVVWSVHCVPDAFFDGLLGEVMSVTQAVDGAAPEIDAYALDTASYRSGGHARQLCKAVTCRSCS